MLESDSAALPPLNPGSRKKLSAGLRLSRSSGMLRGAIRATQFSKTVTGIQESLHEFFSPEKLLQSVEEGTVAPLSGAWLIEQHRRGGRLGKRQNLPPEAFFSPVKLRNLVQKLGDDWGLLLVALSYRWLDVDDPGALEALLCHAYARESFP